MSIVNIAGYRFVTLDKLATLKAQLKACCQRLSIKGTILLAEEGINLMLAAPASAIDAFIAPLTADARFEGMTFKKSYSDTVPFQRMRVRIKKEIITMGQLAIHPAIQTGEYLPASTFKQWLDEGRDMLVLDTRNRYEVAQGTFHEAKDLAIDNFREFPEALAQLEEVDKEKPLVMFCTGGIRCEKASALMMKKGFKQVYQLEGGILAYFEACGGAHYQGDCFVFDERLSLDSHLAPANE